MATTRDDLPPVPDATATFIEARLGERGRRWLAAVRATAARSIDRWSLRPSERALTGATWSYLLPCLTVHDDHVVLKLSAHPNHPRREARALLLWRHLHPPVRLLAYCEEDEALLVEQVFPGSHHQPDSAAQLAPLLAALHGASPPPPQGFITQEDVVAEMLRIAARRLSADTRHAGLALRRVQSQSPSLLASTDKRSHRLLHGDLSPGNVLDGATGPRLVDAAGVIGEPEFEVASCCVYFSSGDPGDWVDALSTTLALDPARVAAWARLHALQSAGYAMEFGGSAEWIEDRLAFALA